jgi:hypothetical protein
MFVELLKCEFYCLLVAYAFAVRMRECPDVILGKACCNAVGVRVVPLNFLPIA